VKLKVLAFALVAALLWLGGTGARIVQASRTVSTRTCDAAIVLGEGVEGAQPSPVFEGRLQMALKLHEAKRVRLILLTGGKSDGDSVSEAEAARNYLMARGVPSAAIVLETGDSKTTHGNLTEAKIAMQRHALTTALIVSDPLHMYRSRLMCSKLGIDAEPAPTEFSRYTGFIKRTQFLLREIVFVNYWWLVGE